MAIRTLFRGGKISFPERVRKEDTQKLVVQDILTYEDDFAGLYWEKGAKASNLLVQPPFNPTTLTQLITRNNILAQCIQTMEVNIDGTGYRLEKIDQEGEDNEQEKEMLEGFFNEPYPDTSFTTIRRDCRFDLEVTGNGYIEVMRNPKGEIVMLRRLDSTMMRLVRLDEAVLVEKEIDRNGKTVKAKMYVRERRFAMKVGNKVIYFKEYGASRNLDRETGMWEGEGDPTMKNAKLPIDRQASEVIHLTLERDPTTHYGLPRWINQLPSILGSRKAEEFNLEFFDSGGLPPAIVFIQGGALVQDVKEQLMGYLSGNSNHRMAVVEVQSTSGTLESAGSVKVSTERFGDSKADAMFQTYDANCEEHVRVGFRLPPLFVGRAQDYNFATAMTAYLVTEAQVFAPERGEFDEIVNKKITKHLGAKVYKFASNPVTLKNIEIQLKAIELVSSKVDGEQLITTINQLTGLDLEYSQEAEDRNFSLANPMKVPAEGAAPPANGRQDGLPNPNPKNNKGNVVPIRKGEMSPEAIVGLVSQWAIAMGLDAGTMPPEDRETIRKSVEDLTPVQRRLFDNILATKSFSGVGTDPSGLAEIASCCADHLSGQ